MSLQWRQILNAFADGTSVSTILTNGYITGIKTGIATYLPSSTFTTCTLADTWYPINGSFVNNPIENFTLVATPAIRYDGTLTQYMKISVNASVKVNKNSTTIHLGVKLNGTITTPSITSQFLKVSGEAQTTSGTSVVELSTNDEIQLVCMSDGDGDIITFDSLSATIGEFFD